MDAWSRIVRRCHEATKKPNKTKWKSGTDFVFAFRYRHRARVTRTQHFIAFIPRISRVEPSFFVHSVYVLFTTFTNLTTLCDFPPKVILDSWSISYVTLNDTGECAASNHHRTKLISPNYYEKRALNGVELIDDQFRLFALCISTARPHIARHKHSALPKMFYINDKISQQYFPFSVTFDCRLIDFIVVDYLSGV